MAPLGIHCCTSKKFLNHGSKKEAEASATRNKTEKSHEVVVAHLFASAIPHKLVLVLICICWIVNLVSAVYYDPHYYSTTDLDSTRSRIMNNNDVLQPATPSSSLKHRVVFVSHGSPTLVIEHDSPTNRFLKQLGRDIGQPSAIICISAHWEARYFTIKKKTHSYIIIIVLLKLIPPHNQNRFTTLEDSPMSCMNRFIILLVRLS